MQVVRCSLSNLFPWLVTQNWKKKKSVILVTMSWPAEMFGLTFDPVASIPERKAICAIAMATTRLKRIWICSCFKFLKEQTNKTNKNESRVNINSVVTLEVYLGGIARLVSMLYAHLSRRTVISHRIKSAVWKYPFENWPCRTEISTVYLETKFT